MSSLNLHQRRPHDIEAILENTYFDDNGNTIYTVHTPLKLFDSTSITTISKVVHGHSDSDKARSLPPDGDDKHPTPSHEADGDRSTFEYIAQIEWKILESSKIRLGSTIVDGTLLGSGFKDMPLAKIYGRPIIMALRNSLQPCNGGIAYGPVLPITTFPSVTSSGYPT
ncbi:hypothetical protein GG344DRAFT_71133 [Lentinula edodes]|nr:hypothetical protein GG344DRAFT_71133 [Lentinula edodes]